MTELEDNPGTIGVMTSCIYRVPLGGTLCLILAVFVQWQLGVARSWMFARTPWVTCRVDGGMLPIVVYDCPQPSANGLHVAFLGWPFTIAEFQKTSPPSMWVHWLDHLKLVVLFIDGVLLNWAFWCAPFLCLVAWRIWAARQQLLTRARTGRCLRCGYDLRGGGTLCPECGARGERPSHPTDELQVAWRRIERLALVYAAMVALIYAYGIIAMLFTSE